MNATRAIRLISRITAEKSRRGRTPRRGVATWFPGFGVNMPAEEGSAGELTMGTVFPSLDLPINGHPATPIAQGSRLTVTWPTEDVDGAASIGGTMPDRQADHFIPNEIFGYSTP